MSHPGNLFVNYLAALRTQTDTGNAFCVHEARGSADTLRRFGLAPKETLVRTRLDTLVEEAAGEGFPFRIVFLTGDAGDGKTAACEALAERLLGRPLSEEERGQQRLQVNAGDGWTILKDASELNAPDDPATNFEEILARECVPSAPRRLFIAVNEGRLRAACHRVQDRNPWIWDEAVKPVLAAREGDGLQVYAAEEAVRATKVLVLNLRDRCLPADHGTFDHMLNAAVSVERWENGGCRGCPFIQRCHIVANASALRRPPPRGRLQRLLLAAYDAGVALPFRRLQGLLAYIITGGYVCMRPGSSDAQVMRSDYTPTEAAQARYYNLAFGLASSIGETTRPEPLCRLLAPADPAALPAPEVDRLLGGLPAPAVMSKALGVGFRNEIEGAYIDAASSVQDEQSRAEIVRHLKRFAFFECDVACTEGFGEELDAAIHRFAGRFPWESFDVYDRCMVSDSSKLEDALSAARSVVVRGLNALDDPAKATREALSSDQADPLELLRGRRLGLRFRLRVEPVPQLERVPSPPRLALRYLEHRPTGLTLRVVTDESGSDVRLRIDLGLFELLFAAANGFSAPQAFGTYLLDIRRFKERLIDALVAQREPQADVVISGHGQDFIISIKRGPDGDAIDVLTT